MKKLLFLLLLPILVFAQPAQDLYISFPSTYPLLGTDSLKIWVHIPANYPTNGGGMMLGIHGLGDPNTSFDIRKYLTETSDNYGLLLACPEPYLGQENASLIAKSKDVINETIDSLNFWYQTDLNKTYICGYSAGSDVASHYTLENPKYKIKGLIWYAPGFYGSLLYPNIDTAFVSNIPPICLCHGTTDLVSQTSANKIENIFSNSNIPFLKVAPAGIGHTMNYPAITSDIATCMNFINANSNVSIYKSTSLKIQVIPNPFSDVLYIETNIKKAIKVELFDISGIVIKSENYHKDEIKYLDVKDLSNGLYFLKIVDNEYNSNIVKIIKM